MGGAAPYLAPSVRFWFRVVPYSLGYCDRYAQLRCVVEPGDKHQDFPYLLYLHQRSLDFALAYFPLKFRLPSRLNHFMMLTTTITTANLALDLSHLRFTHEQFVQLCETNQELRLELTANGELIIMPPAFSESSKQNSDLNGQVWLWNRTTQLGDTFDSSGGFTLPNGAERAPDVSWVEKSRLEGVSLNQFLPLAPDFVIELRSSSDRLSLLQKKMQEYQDNGVRLGWLINPQDRQVEIYRIGKDKQVVQSPTQLSGEDVLAGFTLDLTTVW